MSERLHVNTLSDFTSELKNAGNSVILAPQPYNRIGLRQLFEELPGLSKIFTEQTDDTRVLLKVPNTPVLNEIIDTFLRGIVLGMEFVDVEGIIPDDEYVNMIAHKKVPRAKDSAGLYHDSVFHTLGAITLPIESGQAFIELAKLSHSLKCSAPAYSKSLSSALAKAFEDETAFALFKGFDDPSELNGAHLLSATLRDIEYPWSDFAAEHIKELGYETLNDGTVPKERVQVIEHYRLLQELLSQPGQLISA